jgi:hypothetical protein
MPKRELGDTLEIYETQEIPIEIRRLTSVYEANLTRKRLGYNPKPGGARDEAHYNELLRRRASYDIIKRIHFEVVLKVLDRRNLYSFAIGDGETVLDQLAECHAHLETLEKLLGESGPLSYESIQEIFLRRKKGYIQGLESKESFKDSPLLEFESRYEARDFILSSYQNLPDAESMVYTYITEFKIFPNFYGTVLYEHFHLRENQSEEGIFPPLIWIRNQIDPFVVKWDPKPSMEGGWHEIYFYQRVSHYLVRGFGLSEATNLSFEDTLRRKPDEGGDWYDDLHGIQHHLITTFTLAFN